MSHLTHTPGSPNPPPSHTCKRRRDRHTTRESRRNLRRSRQLPADHRAEALTPPQLFHSNTSQSRLGCHPHRLVYLHQTRHQKTRSWGRRQHQTGQRAQQWQKRRRRGCRRRTTNRLQRSNGCTPLPTTQWPRVHPPPVTKCCGIHTTSRGHLRRMGIRVPCHRREWGWQDRAH